jgi:hypothetical protein
MAMQSYGGTPSRIGKVAPGTKRGLINSAMKKPAHDVRHPKTGRYCKKKGR